MKRTPNTPAPATALRRRAEVRLRKPRRQPKSAAGGPKSAADTQRLLHELEVHHVELELQNAELQEARDGMEALLKKYTDLYDYAPVGYFTLDEAGRILEVNLTGATLLGVERSRLISRRFLRFVAATSQPLFLSFLERIFAGAGSQVSEAVLVRAGGADFWANFHAASCISPRGAPKLCRVAISDITALKQAEEVQRRLEILAATNQELEQEIARRRIVEASLKQSQQRQGQLLAESRKMQEQLRHLSRQVLQAQEEERKRISRELHDVIAQTLTGINVQLATLKMQATMKPKDLIQNISRTQRLVEQSVDIVHRFARELRPAVLDDLGLVPALHSYVQQFTTETGLLVSLTSFTAGRIKGLDHTRRTVLYRVAQEALTNVARHAHASRVELSLQKLQGALLMQIKDNGKSFSVERVLDPKRNKRLGLIGMRERAEMVGGTFTVESAPGQGTTILARIPLATSRRGGGGDWPMTAAKIES